MTGKGIRITCSLRFISSTTPADLLDSFYRPASSLVYNEIVRFTSGATPVDLPAWQLSRSNPHTCKQALVDLSYRCLTACNKKDVVPAQLALRFIIDFCGEDIFRVMRS